MGSKVFIKNKDYSNPNIDSPFKISNTDTITLEFINSILEASFSSLNISQFINDSGYLTSTSLSNIVLVDILANTNISKYDIVTSDGYLASTGVVGKRNRTLGFANQDISTGFIGSVVTEGAIQNSTWTWTIGLPIFLNGTSPSQTCPSIGFTQILGVAVKPDVISVEIHQSILL